jgi:hypothetical protein
MPVQFPLKAHNFTGCGKALSMTALKQGHGFSRATDRKASQTIDQHQPITLLVSITLW